MRMLVTGCNGQIVSSLIDAGANGALDILAFGRPTLDLTDLASVARAIDAAKPGIIVNAAAYTAVDKAESEPALAMAINRDGAGAVASAAARLGVPVIHISTDYVYAGDKSTPYVESDPVGPLGVYGATKLAGELAVAAANPRHLILRTAWVFSPFGGNFVKTMLRLAGERPMLEVVDDQRGSPTYAPHLASAIAELARKVAGRPAADSVWGVYHIANAGETTWCGLAREVMDVARRHGASAVPVKPIATAAYPTPARRPANSRLDCGKLEQVFAIALPDWRDGVGACVARLANAKPGPSPLRSTT